MKIFKLNSIAKRLILGFGLVLFIVVALIAVITTFDDQVATSVKLAKLQSSKVLMLKNTLLNVRQARVQMWTFAATGDKSYIKARDDAGELVAKQFSEMDALLTNPTGRQLSNDFHNAVIAFMNAGKKMNDMQLAGMAATAPEFQAAIAEVNKTAKDYATTNDRATAFYQDLYEKALAEADDMVSNSKYLALAGGGVALLVGMAISWWIARSISKPVSSLVKTMESMVGGTLDVNVPNTERSDEIGSMARTVEAFRKSLMETERLREQATQTEAQNAENMKRARNQIADQFQAKMGALANAFAKSSAEVSDSAKNLSATAEETSRQAQAVSGAAEEASANVQTVAASTEEMSASIREIAGQVAKSSEVANTAANEASRTEADVKALSEAATKIGEVVDLINNIAGQTNLLALNATIEAARAGEAGRGFAVVASEVKQLAAQTARATDEIGSKINEIQQATNRTVGSIDKIVGTVAQIQQISTIIATAIEEQGAATGEISSNTQLAARGTEDVTNNINGVGRAAEMTGAASTQLMGLAGGLSTQAADLQREVTEFVKQLRAG